MKRLLIALLCLSPCGASATNTYWEAYARAWAPYFQSLVQQLQGSDQDVESNVEVETGVESDASEDAHEEGYHIFIDHDDLTYASVIYKMKRVENFYAISFGEDLLHWYDIWFGGDRSEAE